VKRESKDSLFFHSRHLRSFGFVTHVAQFGIVAQFVTVDIRGLVEISEGVSIRSLERCETHDS